MEKEFLPYQESLELKELGFKEKCAAHYIDEDDLELKWKIYRNLSFNTDNCVQAPLYQQAFRWFREKHGLDYEITSAGKKDEYHAFVDEYIYGNNGSSPSIFSYEEAELECLKKLITIVERKPEAYS
jgi:hypothetical protein